MSPGMTTRVVSGATLSSLAGLLMFSGLTTTRYPVSRALGPCHDTSKEVGPTSEMTRLVGAGMTERDGHMQANKQTHEEFGLSVLLFKRVYQLSVVHLCPAFPPMACWVCAHGEQ